MNNTRHTIAGIPVLHDTTTNDYVLKVDGDTTFREGIGDNGRYAREALMSLRESLDAHTYNLAARDIEKTRKGAEEALAEWLQGSVPLRVKVRVNGKDTIVREHYETKDCAIIECYLP